MRQKKAQITLFLFLGILIILLIVGVVLMYTKEDPTSIRHQDILTRAEMQPIKDYVESCLDLVSDDALDLIGKQGFALFKSQGGTTPDPDPNREGKDYLKFMGEPVVNLISMEPENLIQDNGKVIISNSKTASETFGDTTVLVYPWYTFPLDPFTNETKYYLGSGFGWNKLPPLNRIGPNSIEEQLEGYIKTNMPNCIVWDEYPEFTFNTKNPKAEVIFAKSSTVITFKWIIEMFDNQGRKGVLDAFITSRPVRMHTIHNYVKTLIDNDVNDITFDIYQNDSEMKMFIERDYPSGGSVIRIVDPLSRIREREYEIRFARQNRPPALFYIDQDMLNDRDHLIGNCEGVEISFSGHSFTVRPGQSGCSTNFTLTLEALDADEETTTFTASGVTGLPYTIAHRDVISPFPCLLYTITATDGHDSDWQKINLRMKSILHARNCTQT